MLLGWVSLFQGPIHVCDQILARAVLSAKGLRKGASAFLESLTWLLIGCDSSQDVGLKSLVSRCWSEDSRSSLLRCFVHTSAHIHGRLRKQQTRCKLLSFCNLISEVITSGTFYSIKRKPPGPAYIQREGIAQKHGDEEVRFLGANSEAIIFILYRFPLCLRPHYFYSLYYAYSITFLKRHTHLIWKCGMSSINVYCIRLNSLKSFTLTAAIIINPSTRCRSVLRTRHTHF